VEKSVAWLGYVTEFTTVTRKPSLVARTDPVKVLSGRAIAQTPPKPALIAER
jgi:hypothetical protein